jgi:hypothetical protein
MTFVGQFPPEKEIGALVERQRCGVECRMGKAIRRKIS